jgi:hypothetical protein
MYLDHDGDAWACSCDRAGIADPPTSSPAQFEIVGLDGVDGRARTWPGTSRIEIDRAWWGTLTRRQREAVLAHELAHHDDPRWCERCADARAGARMRYAGRSATDAARALGSVVSGRRSAGPALWGWRAADQRLSIDREAGAARQTEAQASRSSWWIVGVGVAVAVFVLVPRSRPLWIALPGLP